MMTPEEILKLPLDHEESESETVGDYLVNLLLALWREREDFSGKRPFGSSGWQFDLYLPLIKAGVVAGTIDEENDWIEEMSYEAEEAADQIIELAIKRLWSSGD